MFRDANAQHGPRAQQKVNCDCNIFVLVTCHKTHCTFASQQQKNQKDKDIGMTCVTQKCTKVWHDCEQTKLCPIHIEELRKCNDDIKCTNNVIKTYQNDQLFRTVIHCYNAQCNHEKKMNKHNNNDKSHSTRYSGGGENKNEKDIGMDCVTRHCKSDLNNCEISFECKTTITNIQNCHNRNECITFTNNEKPALKKTKSPEKRNKIKMKYLLSKRIRL